MSKSRRTSTSRAPSIDLGALQSGLKLARRAHETAETKHENAVQQLDKARARLTTAREALSQASRAVLS